MKNKLEAKLGKDEILVNAKFIDGKQVVHEINTAFPLDTPEEVIREEVEKAGALFKYEQVQQIEQKEVDIKFESAQGVIDKLNK